MTEFAEVPIVRAPEDLSPAWLQRVLASPEIERLEVEPVGTGQMSQSHRVQIEYEDAGASNAPSSVIVKLAASDAGSRATGVGMGAYAREIRFYRDLAGRLGPVLALCYGAVYDEREGWFTLVLEDVRPAVQGDQIAGCTVDAAHLAITALAELHAPVLGDPELTVEPWLNQPNPLNQALLAQLLPGFLDRYGDRVAPEHRVLCECFVASLDGWRSEECRTRGLVHGDYRLDNLLFAGGPEAPRALTVVDWQTVGFGPPMVDASYFIGGGLSLEDRRTHEHELIATYHSALAKRGAETLSFEQCWEGYRAQSFHGVMMAIAASMLVERTERGDDMFMTTLARHAQQALDLDALELLPAAGTGRPAALRPAADDEEPHPAGPEELFNESWYFDVISEGGTIGAYVRLGLYPNLGLAWYTAFVCGPGRATVAAIDLSAPLPTAGSLSTSTDRLNASQRCEAALERYRVTLTGEAEAHDDPAALLRGEPGRPAELGLDLVWETAGEPYQYRIATRYEIPCQVSGTVSIDGEELQLRGAGQRDHSWGTRDWWAMDWVWSAGRLDDGTRLHAVELRIPEMPRIGIGYVQSPDASLVELDAVSASEEVAEDGLVTRAALELAPAGLRVEAEPLAFAPLRLESDDGRVAQFPRAMCRLTAQDGRKGYGWLEWCRNQR